MLQKNNEVFVGIGCEVVTLYFVWKYWRSPTGSIIKISWILEKIVPENMYE